MFFYFVPKVKSVTDDQLDQFKLGHIRDPHYKIYRREVVQGINGQPGVILGSSANWTEEQVKFKAELQWHPLPGKVAYCGHLPDALQNCKSIEGLLKGDAQRGEYLQDVHGRNWLIPYVQKFYDDTYIVELPQTYGMSDDGHLIPNQVDPQFQAIYTHVTNYLQAASAALEELENSEDDKDNADVSFSFTIPNAEQMMLDAFAVNYRVSILELTLLQAIRVGDASRIMDILTDANGMDDLKKEPAHATGGG